jgi:hypothetical protein
MTHRKHFKPSPVLWFVLPIALVAIAGPAAARTINDHRDPSRGGSAYTLTVTPIVELVLTYAAGQGATCQTSNLSPNTDPVLHILEVRQGPPVEVARDDDGAGNLNARVAFTAPANGQVRLVMRAAGASTGGTADLTCTAYQPMRGLIVGGAFKRIENYRDREKLMTVPLATGPLALKAYVVTTRGKIVQRFVSGPESAVLINSTTMPTGTFQVMLGSHPGTITVRPQTGGGGRLPTHDIRGTSPPAARADRAPPVAASPRGPRPDVAVAPPAVAEISRLPDPPGDIRLIRNDNFIAGHDPDVDGLGTELEAHIGTCSKLSGLAGNWECSRAKDPRDTDGDGLTDRDELVGIIHKTPYQLLPRWGADPRHKDLFIEIDFRLKTKGEAPRKLSREMAMRMAEIIGDPTQSQLFRLAHAQSLNNPDLKPGIALHVDNGVTPPPNAPVSELTTYGNWGGYSVVPPICTGLVIGRARRAPGEVAPFENCRPARVEEVFPTSMTEQRRGVFHYALGYPGSGGQAGYHTFRLNIPIDSAAAALHELGHNIGLGHGGPEGIGNDANCKPNFPSLMSYSYIGQEDSFSDGYGRSILNNTKLAERAAVGQPASGPGRAYLVHLRDIYKYNVDLTTGDVDWNRDGVISATPVRAYANNDHSSCEYTRVNQMKAVGLSDRSPALTRLTGRTFVLYIDERDRKLHAETTDDPLSCPTIGTGCGPALLHRAIDQPWNAAIEAVDAQSIGGGKILVVYRTAAGLFETTMTRELAFTAPVAIATSTPAAGEFALANLGTTAWLAFRDAAGAARLKLRAPTGVWAADEAIVDTAGQPIGPIALDGAPGLLHTTLGGATLYGVFPIGPAGALRLYTRDTTTGRWALTPWEMAASSSIGKPALAMENVTAGAPIPGRLRILYLQRAANNNHIVRIKTLEAIGVGAGATRKLTDEIHDNVWYYAQGVDLLFEPGVDTNLRAAVATKIENKPRFVELRPKADGVVDFAYRNWNEWEALGIGLCRNRKAGGAQINCFDWHYKPPPQPTPPPPPQPQPPRPSAECLALCRDLVDSCRRAGEQASMCVRQGAQCRAQCAP